MFISAVSVETEHLFHYVPARTSQGFQCGQTAIFVILDFLRKGEKQACEIAFLSFVCMSVPYQNFNQLLHFQKFSKEVMPLKVTSTP
jgi:hypothetical protein